MTTSSQHPVDSPVSAALANRLRRDRRQGRGLSYKVMLGLAPAIDVIGIMAIAGLVYVIYTGADNGALLLYLAAAVTYSLLILIGFEARGLYDFETLKSPGSQALKVVLTTIGAFAALLACGYVLKITEEFSRVWGASTLIGTTLFFIGHRFVFYHAILRSAARGHTVRRLVVVGSGDQARRFLDNLNTDREPWLQVVGVFEDQPGTNEQSLNGHPILGTLDDLVRLARSYEIDEVIVAVPWSNERRIRRIVDRLAELPVGIHLGADLAGYLYHDQRFALMGQVPILKIQHKPLDGWGAIAKAIEDRLLASLLILAFGPLMLAMAAAIKLESPGPVIFRQPRYGFNNRVFEVYKFRTMHHGSGPSGPVAQATKHDPRVTKVGRILRRASLDELPQLFNVLQGKMSLVGPRPHAVEHNEQYAKLIRGYFARHRVKPGITGWAQVNGLRGETETVSKMAARVRYDVYYIENWSLAFDLWILMRTALVGFIHPNAY